MLPFPNLLIYKQHEKSLDRTPPFHSNGYASLYHHHFTEETVTLSLSLLPLHHHFTEETVTLSLPSLLHTQHHEKFSVTTLRDYRSIMQWIVIYEMTIPLAFLHFDYDL
ncbi:hypothetical protein TSUD_343780 [Trifolium subterraneum]|nr:hypothetical protein TSUD_343780 [Trifolium subterraneum]